MSENIKNDKNNKNNKNNFLDVLLKFIKSDFSADIKNKIYESKNKICIDEDLPADIKNKIYESENEIEIYIDEFIGVFIAMHAVYTNSCEGKSLCVPWNDITNEVLIKQLNEDYSILHISITITDNNNTDDNKTMPYKLLENLSKNESDKEKELLENTYDAIIKVGGEKIYQNLFYLFSCAYLTDCYEKLLQVVSDKYEKLQDKKLQDELLKVMFNITKDSTENYMIEVFLRLIGKYKCTTTDDFLTKHKGTLFYRDLQNKKLQYESELATSLLKNKDLTLGEGVNTDNISDDNFVEVSRLERPSSTVSPDNKTESDKAKNEENQVKKNNNSTSSKSIKVPYSKQQSPTVSPDNKTESKETKSEAIEDYEGCYGCFFHKKKGGRTK